MKCDSCGFHDGRHGLGCQLNCDQCEKKGCSECRYYSKMTNL